MMLFLKPKHFGIFSMIKVSLKNVKKIEQATSESIRTEGIDLQCICTSKLYKAPLIDISCFRVCNLALPVQTPGQVLLLKSN